MDLPSSGWYPDPYGTPRLLRWWDGSVWTQHTHPDISLGGAEAGGAHAGAAPVTGVQATAVQAAAVQATAVQAAVRATGVQATAVQAAAVQASGGQPSTEWLRRTKPPTGRMTQPQPALPDTLAPTALQPGMQPAAQPAVQPTVVQPGYPQPGSSSALASLAGGADPVGTQVMFRAGEPWQAPSDPWQGAGGLGMQGPGGPGMPGPGGPGGPGGPVPGNRFGYLEAQRRRRRQLIGGVTAGTVVAVAAIVVIAMNLGGSPAANTADQSHITTPASAPASTAPAATASTSPSPTVSASPTATTGGSLLSDGQSGISYTQLASPWQGAGCPPSLNNGAFTWTDGEYAVAGQVNSGTATWYGEACSGPLPQQYGYTGPAQLQTIAENLGGTFADAYYNTLQHNTTPEQDQAVQVNGHSGWEVSYDISYTNAAAQGVTWADEQAAVVVVDTGTGGEPAVFFTSVPQNLNEGNVSTLVSSLQLTSASSGLAGTPTSTSTLFGGTNP